MGTASSLSSLKDWVGLFFLYGPFFITLFIMIYGIRQAKAAVDKAETARPRDPDALKMYRRIYVAVWIFSGALVVACCWWWFQNEMHESDKKYVLRLDVSDALPSERLEPLTPGFFVRTLDAEDVDKRKDEFVFIKDKPFEQDDEVEIVHKRSADAARAVKYTVKASEIDLRKINAFKLEVDEKDGKQKLKPRGGPKPAETRTAADLFGIGNAFAGTGGDIVGKPIDLRTQSYNFGASRAIPVAPTLNPAPANLQDRLAADLAQKRQTTGRQLDALEALEFMVDQEKRALELLRPVPGAEAKGETLLSLLLYLTKHQDKLVAFKARRLLDKSNYMAVVTSIATASGTATDVQRQILIALTEREWEQIEKNLSTSQKPGFEQQKRTYGKAASPLPSATSEGTKYFSVTSWTTLNDSQIKCLAEKIYRQNADATTLADQQKQIAQRRAIGMVFDSRAEAAFFADAVKPCGAKTDFVYNGDKRLVSLGR